MHVLSDSYVSSRARAHGARRRRTDRESRHPRQTHRFHDLLGSSSGSRAVLMAVSGRSGAARTVARRVARHDVEPRQTCPSHVWIPKIPLIRGRAELDVVEGIPEEDLQMNGSYETTPEQRVQWEAEVRSLYDGMVRIVIPPAWVTLIDFETTLPTAVEELVRQRAERQDA